MLPFIIDFKNKLNMKFPYNTLDLTHTLSSETPTWEGDCGFNQETIWDYSSCTTHVKFRVQKLNMVAGIGTHIDAPAHCIPSGRTIDKLGLDELIVPCVVVDVSRQTHASYLVTLDDIIAFEQSHGDIVAGCLVIIRTGWDQFWDQPEKYRNNLVFPSVTNEAAQYLLNKGIVGLGIDTLSPDRPDSGYPVHAALLGAGKYIIENVANTSMLPPTGSFVFVLPLKIKDGTEAPVRLIALMPDVSNA